MPHGPFFKRKLPQGGPSYATLGGMIDLHTHSTASDGDLSPQDLVMAAEKRGIGVLALTDHDTLGGLEEAAGAAKAAGIGFIPGIEISINWRGVR